MNTDNSKNPILSKNVSSSNGLEPLLRFPEFHNIWEQKTIGDIFTFVNGKAHEQDVADAGKYIIVNSKYISTDGLVQKYSEKQMCPLYKNDIVMVMSDVPNGKAMSKCLLIDENDKYTLNQRICALRNIEFPLFFLAQINRNQYFMKFDDGVKQTNLRKDDVLLCPVYLTSKSEQKKIAEFLSLVNKRIEQQRQLVEALKRYKRGLLSSVFDNIKETKKLYEIASFVSSTKTLSDISKETSGQYPVYDASGVFGYIDKYDMSDEYISIVKDGSGVGRLQFCQACSSYIGTLGAITTTCCDIKYLYAALQNINFAKFSTGMAIPHIYFRDYKYLDIPFPGKDKQNKLAMMFSELDASMVAESSLLNNLCFYKSGLLQQMFI